MTAADLAEARSLVAGNAPFEAGSPVETRQLPRTGDARQPYRIAPNRAR